MENYKILELIEKQRELSHQLKKIQLELVKLLPDGKAEVWDDNAMDGCIVEKTDTKVLITHFEGWAGSFIRPDVEISIAAASELGSRTSEAKKKSSAENGKKGGRPKKS